MTAGGLVTPPGPGSGGPDRGAQRERTRLAWRRTTLTFTVAAGLAVRSAFEGSVAIGAVAAGAVVLVWIAFLVVAHRRVRELTELPVVGAAGGRLRSAALWTLALTALGVVLLR
ncbi:DUF202 domain-containing protein [Streptomyces sp. N2-109]|uniref:DUF202 domain-containing protein n=1 Tax=Streptomyces gossypii TaxID=2883101 RepID=A0ABT2JM53_9ACTN|nr:DUF202 domain-containing protein [Streptomyces gossypii]MCT2588886.1 DUF202 domain-containing protein [Streptomyces gossypii]